jgi:porin
VWTPTKWLTIAGGVFDPNTQASNFVAHAFDKVNLYTAWIFSYTVGGLPGQFQPFSSTQGSQKSFPQSGRK